MTVRLRTPEEKQVDSVTKALLHGAPDLVYVDTKICASCGRTMLLEISPWPKYVAHYIHGRFPDGVPQCVNADKVYLAEAIKLEVIDPEDYEAMGVKYVPPPGATTNGIGSKRRKGRHKGHRRK